MTDDDQRDEIAAELQRLFSVDATKDRQLTRHIAGPSHIEARVDMPADSAYVTRATMEWRDKAGYEVRELQFSARDDGPAITASGVRDMKLGAIEQFVTNDVMLKRARWSGGGWVEVGRAIKELRRGTERLRPTADVLELVAIVAEYSLLRGGQPIRSIEGMFEVPNRTASRWVSLARQRGFLEDL